MKKVIIRYSIVKDTSIDLDENNSVIENSKIIKSHLYNIENIANKIKVENLYCLGNTFNKQYFSNLSGLLKYLIR